MSSIMEDAKKNGCEDIVREMREHQLKNMFKGDKEKFNAYLELEEYLYQIAKDLKD